MRSPAGTEGMLRGGGGLRNPCDYLRGSDWRRDSACRLCRWPQRPTRAARRVRVAPQWSCSVRKVHPAGFRSRPAWPAAIPPLPLAAEADACSAAGEGGTEVILFFVPSASCGFPLASGERVTSLCSCKEKSPKESTFKQSIPRRTCTRTLRTDENSTQNSVVPGGPVFRFACNERSASGANDVSACDGRVVYGAFIPSQNPRAGPSGEALLSRCFLVTSLHQQRSDPLSAGERKLCSGQQRSDPHGRRSSGSSCCESHQNPAWPSGSSALVTGAGTRLLRFDAHQDAFCPVARHRRRQV